MIILADMPFVQPPLIDELIDVFQRTDAIVIPECQGILRHPRVFPRRFFGEFMSLADDEKGWTVIERHRAEVHAVPVGTVTDYADIDHPRDLMAFQHEEQRQP
jgi:CTP:molybdopterin cytidylyltransferase MocA